MRFKYGKRTPFLSDLCKMCSGDLKIIQCIFSEMLKIDIIQH